MATSKKTGTKRKPPVPVAKKINDTHKAALKSATDAVSLAIKCGELLAKQKAKLEHGEWKSWIEKNCNFEYSTAARYMKAASQKSTGVDFSSLSQLYSPPKKKSSKSPALLETDRENAIEAQNGVGGGLTRLDDKGLEAEVGRLLDTFRADYAVDEIVEAAASWCRLRNTEKEMSAAVSETLSNGLTFEMES